MLPSAPDEDHEVAHLRALVEAPTTARLLYERGGFDGLEANTIQTVVAVALAPSCTTTDLTRVLALAQSTVSTALGRLQDAGLVQAEMDAADARRRRQFVTPEGWKLIRRFLDQSMPVLEAQSPF